MDTTTKKLEIISRIKQITDENQLIQIEYFLNKIEKNTKIQKLHENPAPTTDLQRLVQEQNYNPQNLKGMGGILEDEDESLEELLKLL